MSIVVENLNHRYKAGTPFEKKVLFDVNLEIKDGEFVGLIGPTQSGKTTLAQHFNGLFIPKEGRVLVDGHDLSDKATDIVAVRHQVGYVFQNPENQLFKETVGEDIAFAPINQKCSKEETDRRVRESMELVGLKYDIFFKRDIFALSGGQKRRAAIAGVLAGHPRVLVLDDPTAGLDPRGREEILEVIGRLHREKEMTIVFISNTMEDVARMAKRIVVMNEGRIFADGTTRSIFSESERLRKIGLGIPETIEIMQKLALRGLHVPTDTLTVEETIDAIAAGMAERGGDMGWN
ncbi:MAG: energy-coupling factor transporter ATPase [Bacillota bacterium]|nr:energy-coupling factor transporter ATPase [Bacillota bacterium]MDW7677492.1 energy-coupling factor transporter ATPase [Bacillota bacterium]